MANFSDSTAPFDAVAADYDRQFSETRTGRLQRDAVWRFATPFLPKNGTVLELNCGTGEDAAWFAGQGCRVLATDISAKMVAVAAEKIRRAGLESRVDFQILSIENLSKIQPQFPDSTNSPVQPFQLIFSNFGGFNCLSPEKLTKTDAALANLLSENGRFLAVVMGRFCLWETIYFLAKANLKSAFRRMSRSPVVARLDDSTTVPTWYFSPGELARFFPSFEVEMVRPVGAFLPPSYLDPFLIKQKGWLNWLDLLEKKFGGHRFLAGLADHFLIVLKRRPTDLSVGSSSVHPSVKHAPMVFFTHAYFIEDDPKEAVIMKPYPPLGILYLAAWLDRFGVSNSVFDSTFSSKTIQKKTILAEKPTILAIYSNLVTKLNVLELIHFVKNEPHLSETLIVLGGPDVTHNVENYLAAGADIIVIGEGEQTMLEIAQTVENGNRTQFGHIDGLAFRLEDGSVFKTKSREKLRSIDDLPMPARHKIDLQLYLDAWKNAHGKSAISVSTQRGCPYTCRWCSTAVYGQSYRRRSPQAVADELDFLQKTYAPDLFWFVDDVFTVSHKWLQEFCNELKIRQLAINFECITRADRLNEEVIGLLKTAGCFRVWIGAESGSQRVIDAMDRRVEVGQVREMIRAARRAGIEAGTFIMLGYPGETEADIRETVVHLKESNPDLFTITIAYPIRGTGLFDDVKMAEQSPVAWAKSTDRELDFERTYPRRYYDFAVRWTVNSVHLHKARLAHKSLTFNGLKLFGKVLAARTLMILNRPFA